MASRPEPGTGHALDELVTRAQAGDRAALEGVVQAIQGDVLSLALRFLGNRQDAEDAAQEILVRVVTRLGSFEGRSAFRTWLYRLATNALLNRVPTRMERAQTSFDDFAADLADGLGDGPPAGVRGAEVALLLEEVKIGCTLAMLQCLDRDLRVAYIVGEILELEHREAAEILDVTPAAFRQRLSRARQRITSFLAGHCGLFDPANPCRCGRRLGTAIAKGRVAPDDLRLVANAAQARRFPAVLAEIRQLERTRRAAALYRSHPDPVVRDDFAPRLRRMLSLEGHPVTGDR